MVRKSSLALLILFAAVTASAQNRGHAALMPMPIPGTTVSGIVTAVSGSNVSLANGLVTVDVSQATITDDRGAAATVAPGSMIFAILRSSASLQASTVVVTNIPQVALSGPVQSINAAAGTLQILGLTIHTDANTSFGGAHGIRGLSDIVANDVALVQADASGSTLVASSILVFAPMAQALPTLIHGTVKSIGADSWVITDTRRGDITVLVNAQTRILGSPKAGDIVDVLVNVDSANNYVAIAIAVSPQSMQIHLSGVVKSITPHLTLEPCPSTGCIVATWIVGPAAGLGPDFLVTQTAQTKIVGDPKVGDHVDVVVQAAMMNSGFVAISITKQ